MSDTTLSPDSAAMLGLECTATRVRKLARRVSARFDAALAPYGLTIGQFGILVNLRRRRPQKLCDVAVLLSMDASTLSRSLGPLKSAGLVAAERDPDDARATLLVLTDAGARTRNDATLAWADVQRRIDAALGPEARRALHGQIDAAISALTL